MGSGCCFWARLAGILHSSWGSHTSTVKFIILISTHTSICTITQPTVECTTVHSCSCETRMPDKGHDKKCENFNPTTKEKHPFFFSTKIVDSEKNIALIRLKASYYFRRGRECERENESEKDVGFELIAEDLDDGSNNKSSDKACTRPGVPQPWHTTIEQRAGSCSHRVRK